MRKAEEKLLSILLAVSMCLATGAHARADAAVSGGNGPTALPPHASAADPADTPAPDPEPPEEDMSGSGDETLVISDGESVTLQDEALTVPGSDPLSGGGEGYINAPEAGDMAAPPWPLGVNGGSRAVALTGTAPGLSLVRTDVTVGGWGALSVEADRDADLMAVDAKLRVLSAADGGLDSGWALLGYDEGAYGSGYGAYLRGCASAYFYGVTVSDATYGAVLDGVERAWFGSSRGTVLLYDGADLAGSVRGRGRTSDIDSVFGLLMCGDADSVTVEDGASIRAADAAVLYKDGSGAFTFNNARLASDSGVLFQMMDNDDDDRIGRLLGSHGFSPVYDEANASGGPGFPTIDRDIVAAIAPKLEDSDALPPAAQAQQVAVTYANGLYSGNIYNGTGYYGQPGDSLAVTVGRGAVLDGDISLTSTIKAIPYSRHAVEALDGQDDIRWCFVNDIGAPCGEDQAAYIQFTRYTIRQYYLQGHVQNLPYYNGSASLDVTVAQDGVWAVKDMSIVTSLTVADGGLVYGQVRDNGDGSVTLLPADEPLEPGVYASDIAAFAAAQADEQDGDGQDAPAEDAPRQAVITIGGQDYALDVYEQDGGAYVRLTDLIALFFGGLPAPGI